MKAWFYYGKPGARKGGYPYDVGEDALPYVSDMMVSVADGTGGRALGWQREIAPGLTQAEHSFDIATEGCFDRLEEWRYQQFRDQYDESFAGLYAYGDPYEAGQLRKSSYFGSRLTQIFMRELLERDGHDMLNDLRRRHAKEQERTLVSIEEHLEIQLKKRLTRAAKNCGINASNIAHSSMMGTTYSGVVFQEEERCVHLLTVQSGDSRCLALVPVKEGEGNTMLALRSLIPVQRRENDGGLTNCIGANHDFYFRCGYHRIEKPCAVMVVTDGACEAFPPGLIGFEKFVMDKLWAKGTEDLQGAVNAIRQHFEASTQSTIDDSATMALAAFGFKSYESLKFMAYRRSQHLKGHEVYGPLLEDPLRWSEAEGLADESIALIAQDENAMFREEAQSCWEQLEAFRALVTERVGKRFPEELRRVRAAFETQERAALQQQDAAAEQLAQLVRGAWLELRPGSAPREESSGKPWHRSSREAARYADLGDKIRELQRQVKTFQQTQTVGLEEVAELAREYARQCDLCREKQPEADMTEVCRLGRMLAEYQERIEEISVHLGRLQDQLEGALGRLLDYEAPQIRRFTETLLAGEGDARALLPQALRGGFEPLLREHEECRQRVQRSQEESRQAQADKARTLFISRAPTYLRACLEETPCPLPQEMQRHLRKKQQEIAARYEAQLRDRDFLSQALQTYRGELEEIMLTRS